MWQASACAGLQSRLAPRLSPYSANLLSELPRCILLVMRGLLIVATFLFSLTAKADDWGPLQFLVGQWTGEGGGEPGQGSGSFSFTPDLQGKILVRKNVAEYPPSKEKPAYRHDDLMVIYRDGHPASFARSTLTARSTPSNIRSNLSTVARCLSAKARGKRHVFA